MTTHLRALPSFRRVRGVMGVGGLGLALSRGVLLSRGVQNRGFGLEVSDLRGDLDANERVEMGNTCLGGE